MEQEERMSQDVDGQARDDAFLAGMDPEGQRAETTDQDRAPDGAEVAGEVENRPPAQEPGPEPPAPQPTHAADTPQARAQRFHGVEEFARAFPEAYAQARQDPDTIPDSVWQAVGQGMSLTAAYARYAVDRAQNDARTAQQNRENAQRSTGSMRSAGGDAVRDAFLAGFDL